MVQLAADQVREAKVQIESYLARDIKSSNKSFYWNVSGGRKTREEAGPLQKETGNLVIQDKEKVEILNDFFVLIVTSKGSNHSTQVTEGKGRN